MGVFSWAIWQTEVSEFGWHYDETETCYFLEGCVVVTPNAGEPVSMSQGDLVTFPAGMSCNWRIDAAVREHYSFKNLE
ncbi:MAG: cupin domain-containing protein [Cyanobacteria bacterium P01_H01_bin.105]